MSSQRHRPRGIGSSTEATGVERGRSRTSCPAGAQRLAREPWRIIEHGHAEPQGTADETGHRRSRPVFI